MFSIMMKVELIKNWMKRSVVIIPLLCLVLQVRAQDNALVFLKGVPQSMQTNPAFRPVKGSYMALPALGGIKLNAANTGFSWSDMFRPGTGAQADSLYLDLDHLSGVVKEQNVFSNESSLQLFGFGFYMGNTLISFDLKHRVKARLAYPGSIFNLRYGNWDYDQNMPINHSLSEMQLDAMNYTEVAFGLSMPVTDNVVVGARFKYLFGAMNIQSEDLNIGVETLENGDMRVYTRGAILTSIPLIIERDDQGMVESFEFDSTVDRADLVTSNNQGFGLDFGLTWQVWNNLTLGAAVNDLGYINWKSNGTRLMVDDEFVFSGMDISSTITGVPNDEQNYWNALSDSIMNVFQVSDESTTFKTGLYGHINLSAQYSHRNWLNVGAVARNYYVGNQWMPELTLAGGLNAGKAISTVLTYSMRKNDYASLGAGLSLKGGPLQIYVVTDNLDSFLAPEKAKYINAQLGVNMVF
jgi:hypothetical protein